MITTAQVWDNIPDSARLAMLMDTGMVFEPRYAKTRFLFLPQEWKDAIHEQTACTDME